MEEYDWTYTFDPHSRLTCAVQGSTCASGSTRVLFTMDALDRATTRVKGSSTTSLTYRGLGEMIAKTVNGSTTTTYASGAGDAPLGEKTGSTASFYLRDTHGDVVGLASTAAANQGTRAFDPWGVSLATTGQVSFLGYQGDMTDADSKQVDMGTRWYQAGLGRFTARDVLFGELTSPMTLNQHVYGGLNPVTMWDPTGMYQDDGGGAGPCKGVTCGEYEGNGVWSVPSGCSNCDGSQTASVKIFPLPKRPTQGLVHGGHFIRSRDVAVPLREDLLGDDRAFDSFATASDYRVFIRLNFEKGFGVIRANPSCTDRGRCRSALDLDPSKEGSSVDIIRRRGDLTVTYSSKNSIYDEDYIAPAIDGTLTISSKGGVGFRHETFPSFELYREQNGVRVQSYQYREWFGPPLGLFGGA
jgi:RHS repeat-associated protein